MRATQEHIDTFIQNVNRFNGGLYVESVARILLGNTKEIYPTSNDPDVFLDCLVAYLESVEEYELCGSLTKKRSQIKKRLIPMSEYAQKMTKSLVNFLHDIDKKK